MAIDATEVSRSINPISSTRICLLIYSVAWGGMEIHTLEVVRTLRRRGHRVTIAELNDSVFRDRDLPAGLEIVELRPERPLAEVSFREWRHLLKPLAGDVAVFANGGGGFPGSLSLDLAARSLFRRYITIEHMTPPAPPAKSSRSHLGGIVPGFGLWWYKRMAEVYARSLGPHQMITVSRAGRDRLVEDYGFPARKVVPIANGIDTDRYRPDPARRRASRGAWQVPQNAVVFGSVSRLLNSHKGLDVALECFVRLVRQRPDQPLWYVLVGDGPDRDNLTRQAQAAGVAGRVVFAGTTDRPWEAHCGIDSLLLPSHVEGMPLTLLEGMASGCCPVAMGVGGVRDVISDATLGWVAPPGDREAFLGGMQAALDLGADGRAAMGVRARQHVIDHFRAQEQYGKIADLIQRI